VLAAGVVSPAASRFLPPTRAERHPLPWFGVSARVVNLTATATPPIQPSSVPGRLTRRAADVTVKLNTIGGSNCSRQPRVQPSGLRVAPAKRGFLPPRSPPHGVRARLTPAKRELLPPTDRTRGCCTQQTALPSEVVPDARRSRARIPASTSELPERGRRILYSRLLWKTRGRQDPLPFVGDPHRPALAALKASSPCLLSNFSPHPGTSL